MGIINIHFGDYTKCTKIFHFKVYEKDLKYLYNLIFYIICGYFYTYFHI